MEKESHIQLGNLIIIAVTFLAAVLLVTMTEGRVHYWHLFIIPLLLAVFTYNMGGGLAVWFLFVGFIVWSILYLDYPPNNVEIWMDIGLCLAIAIGLGVYAKRIKRTRTLLEKLSERDSLTGLENYSHFINRLTEEKNRSDRYETPFSLILIDIDCFKKINDSYGHEIGNEVLKKIAHTILTQTRTIDLGARYGGDEFSVVLTNADAISALRLAERLQEEIGKLSFKAAGTSKNVSVSMGIASYPKNAGSETELIVRADQALYRAKAEGRNRICVYSTPSDYCSLEKTLV